MKFRLAIIVCLINLTVFCSSAPPIPQEKKYLIAVMPVSVEKEIKAEPGELATVRDAITLGILQSGRARLMERSQIDSLLKERELEQSGVIAPAAAKELGALLGAEALLITTITSVKTFKLDDSLAPHNSLAVTVTASCRIVNTATGEILAAVQSEKTGSQNKDFMQGVIGTGSTDTIALRAAAISAVGTELGWYMASEIPAKP
ncbi:MAG: hypothetical protein KDK38_02685 [Leptospiraceae bacterium]|nr:hypothetical protein [Leptospiraceae bacterium]